MLYVILSLHFTTISSNKKSHNFIVRLLNFDVVEVDQNETKAAKRKSSQESEEL